MKKAIAIILVLVSALSLFACGGDDVPKGMQLARGGESEGYYFYVPEEWTVSNIPGISTAYVSTITSTSVSFSEISATEFAYDPEKISEEDYFLKEYFYKSMGEFPTKVTHVSGDENAKIEGEIISDVSADQPEQYRPQKQRKFVFQYKYKNGDSYFTYRFTQIYLVKGGRYFIMQYFGVAEKYNVEADGTLTKVDGFKDEYDNDTYLEKFESCRRHLKLLDTAKGTDGANDGNPDEFVAVSNPKLSGFTMYAPTTFKVDYSNAMVSLTAKDGSNVMLTEAVGLNATANDYMMQRKEELSQIVTDFTWITELTPDESGNMVLKYNAMNLGNLPKRDNNYNWSLVFEYTYTYGGEKYRVLQILATDVTMADIVLNQPKGYVFTYTAKVDDDPTTVDNYDLHLDEVKEIIKRLEF